MTDNTEISDIFSQWSSNCLDQKANASPSAQASAISIAQEYFTNTSYPTKQLALLLASIGDKPISSKLSSSKSKLFALKYLRGSLQAFHEQKHSHSHSHSQTRSLSIEITKTLAQFLLQLCGPIVNHEYNTNNNNNNNDNDNDNDTSDATMQDDQDNQLIIVTSDDVRDEAVKCTSALLQISLNPNEAESTNVHTSLSSFLEFRVLTATQTVHKRCTSLEDCMDEDDDDDDDDDEYINGNEGERGQKAKMLSGLSILPRAKRAICFRVLESALQGIQCDKDGSENSQECPISASCSNHLVDFAVLAGTCLIGETDPRCLVQMLRLLFQMQSVLAPIVEDAIQNNSKQEEGEAVHLKGFPYTAIFDSAAVYYPVRFTPPPNDPHGITKEGITHALMDVITFCTPSSHHHDEVISEHAGQDDGNANMVVLATGLFLERLSPPRPLDPYGDDEEEQDISTVQDRIEALEDLSSLLLSSTEGEHEYSVMKKLNPASVKEMSNVLYRCHDNAAASVTSSTSDEEKNDFKTLADACRHFVTRIAYGFERMLRSPNINPIDSFWDIFVKDRVKDLVGIIASSPQSLKGRMAIAYLASLSACGGEKTLRLCLDMCIPRLAGLLDENIKSQDSNRDKEKMSTVVYGISILFSSCRLSMEKMTKDGINLHPHPLRAFGSRIVQTLCHIIEDIEGDSMDDLGIAAVKALESVLLSTPALILNEPDGDDSSTVRDTVLFIAKMLVADIAVDEDGSEQWKVASARLVGSTIGKGLQSKKGGEDNPNSTLLESDQEIVSFVEKTLFPRLIESSCQVINENNPELQRYDWSVLAYACEADQDHAVYEIVSKLYSTLVSIIRDCKRSDSESGIPRATIVANALSHIMNSGGPNAILAFHEVSMNDDTGIDLIEALTENSTGDSSDGHVMEEMSTLLLPETREKYRTQADCAAKLSHSVLPHLLHAYFSDSVPKKQIQKIVSRVSQVLPPLSDWDGAELCTLMPILSVALSSKVLMQEDTSHILNNILRDLVDYALNGEVPGASRSAAASCVFSVIASYQDKDNECIGLTLLQNQIFPIIVGNIEAEDKDSDIGISDALFDAMNFAAMIASAASQRGKKSSITADEVARFFVLVACEGAASAPVLGVRTPLDCNSDNSKQAAATALGSILSVNGNPFAKQRLAHMIIPIVLTSSSIQSSGFLSTDIGTLLCACHIICCVPVKAIGQEKLSGLVSAIVQGFEGVLQQMICVDDNSSGKSAIVDQLISLLLTALLKVYNQSLSTIATHLGTIVPSLLLVTLTMDEVENAAQNLLAIQFLSTLTASTNSGIVHFCKAYKSTVLKHLAQSLDHPSSQVRRAAVKTANVWSIIE